MQSSNSKKAVETLSRCTLQFQSLDTEKKFLVLVKRAWLTFFGRQMIVFLFLLEGIAMVVCWPDFVVPLVGMSIQLLMLLVMTSNEYKKHFFLVNLLVALARMSIKILVDALSKSHGASILLTQLYTFAIVFHRLKNPLSTIGMAFVQLIVYIALPYYYDEDITTKINSVFILILHLCAVGTLHYHLTLTERADYTMEKNIQQESQKINNLLFILMPKFIRDMITQQGAFDISENQGEVSIMFCDICDFDDILAVEKEKIVNLLDNLFRKFDQICTSSGMQKIETVGKTYMAAGGLNKNPLNNPVKQALNLSMEMMQFTQKFKFGQIGGVRLKIGVHYGRVIAGVIGHHKPQFSLIGDTVNTTSRVCSTGEDGQVTLSAQAYQHLGNSHQLNFSKRTVQAKGKGTMDTYVVVNEKEARQKRRNNQRKVIIKEDRSKQKEFVLNIDDALNEEIDPNEQMNLSQTPKQLPKKISKGRQKYLGFPNNNKQVDDKNSQNFQSDQRLPSQLHLSMAKKEKEPVDKNNQLTFLENKLRKEIHIEYVEKYPEYEVDFEKLKILEDREVDGMKEDKLILAPKKLNLGFQDHQRQLSEEFYNKISANGYKYTYFILILAVFSYGTRTLVTLIGQSTIDGYFISYIALRVAGTLLNILQLFHTKIRFAQLQKQSFMIIGFSLLAIFNFAETFMVRSSSSELNLAEFILIITLFCALPLVRVATKFLTCFILTISQCVLLIIQSEDHFLYYFLFIEAIFVLVMQYYLFQYQVNTFNNHQVLSQKLQKSNDLVRHLLPAHANQLYKDL